MSPLNIEAAYERVPLGPDATSASVRWGVRASLGRSEDRRGTARAPARNQRAARAGPREAAAPADDAQVLTYGPRGRTTPLVPPDVDPGLLGRFLDLRA
ncbi:MAG: hypothetical protein KBD01_19270 [Acidobacteria bacterium]|nr:hypothetical protein [Acidobacteriota bacterium]